MAEIRITLRANSPMKRVNEPITCGVPFPKGMLHDDKTLGMFDEAGNQVPLQTRVLDKWSDGSVRWVLCDWQAKGLHSVAFLLRILTTHRSQGGSYIQVDANQLPMSTSFKAASRKRTSSTFPSAATPSPRNRSPGLAIRSSQSSIRSGSRQPGPFLI